MNESDVAGGTSADNAKIGGFIVGLFLVVLAILWFTGSLDSALISAGMPELTAKTPCAENFFGVVMCGDELERFCQENYDADLNGHICGDFLNNAPSQPVVSSDQALAVGHEAVVTNTRVGLNVRDGPSLYATVVGGLTNGDVVSVVGGPVEGDGITWWQIQSTSATGWAGEGRDGIAFLVPK